MASPSVVAADASVTPSSPSYLASPEQRPGSPSPSVEASLALDACPQLSRSVSTPASSISGASAVESSLSSSTRLSDGTGPVVRRRGYIRPQGTTFAESARSRDSVMSLGSIAHMQYYFARTGLLDGKGGQLARGEFMKKRLRKGREMGGLVEENQDPSTVRIACGSEPDLGSLSLADSNYGYAMSDPGVDQSLVESPTDMEAYEWWNPNDPTMLPPTVSTYKVKPEYTEPLPDLPVLRRELKEALQDACKVLEESQKQPAGTDNRDPAKNCAYHEIQGLHVLDIITLAIRAAKNYYTAHTNPKKLYTLRSERELRKDLYNVLDTLKRMATRDFRGGIRLTELTEIIMWIESVDKLLKQEDKLEKAEQAEREAMVWRVGDWTGKEREREWLFLKSFDDPHQPELPPWPESSSPESQQLPTPFLRALQDGQRLVKLHNTCVARSRKNFDEIKSWHTDVGKPYRMADNLRYWAKAAELRWEIRLDFIGAHALSIVYGKDDDTWRAFDDAVFRWCRGVREELTEEWRQEAQSQERKRPPELKIEGNVEPGECATPTSHGKLTPSFAVAAGDDDKENVVPA